MHQLGTAKSDSSDKSVEYTNEEGLVADMETHLSILPHSRIRLARKQRDDRERSRAPRGEGERGLRSAHLALGQDHDMYV